MTLLPRCQSSSQDSAASSLAADKMSHWQNLTPERLQPKANTSSARRKRLVRQFSLWVHPIICHHSTLSPWKYILCRELEAKALLQLLLFLASPVTMKMKIISQKHLQPSPPRAQESQDLPAHWTNRYSHPYIHRWHTHTYSHTCKHTSKSPEGMFAQCPTLHLCGIDWVSELYVSVIRGLCVAACTWMCVPGGQLAQTGAE